MLFAVFFIIYGVTPLLGGDGLGLVGADEPRYAQIAHEMLARFDPADTLKGRLSACVTPYLYGHPWLEKPALYYWRAMFVFQDFGVHDWSARLPSATFAFIMVASFTCTCDDFAAAGTSMPPSLPSPAPASSASPAARPLTCRWPPHSPSACSAGMPGMRPTPSSGSSIFTSSPA